MVTPNLSGRHPSASPRTPGVQQPHPGDGNLPTPNADTEARALAVRNEVECTLDVVKNLSGLAQWIERARALCDAVSCAASATPELAQGLRSWEIFVSDGDWDEVASAGLRELHMVVERRARDALVALTGEAPR
jgi:hypothetical protein